jgi:RNA polymerase sigma factor (sigma-70 family)
MDHCSDSNGSNAKTPASGHRRFATTHWSVVVTAGRGSSLESRAALASLCEDYWYPLYAYVRRRGYQPAEAQDLTQGFLAQVIEQETIQAADQTRGRFRSFLLGSLNHYLAHQWRHDQTQKRGGLCHTLSLDLEDGERRYHLEPADPQTPEKIFERRWAMTLLDKAVESLRREYEQSGKLQIFDTLKIYLGGQDSSVPYREIAAQLGSTEGAVKVAVHRLRQRCRECLRREIAQTVASDQDIDEELRHLFQAVQ